MPYLFRRGLGLREHPDRTRDKDLGCGYGAGKPCKYIPWEVDPFPDSNGRAAFDHAYRGPSCVGRAISPATTGVGLAWQNQHQSGEAMLIGANTGCSELG